MHKLTFKEFREGGSVLGCTGADSMWSCFDTDGGIMFFRDGEFDVTTEGAVGEVTAFAVRPDAEQCAVAVDNCVHIYKYPDVTEQVTHSLTRFTLKITKIE